jgi:hypothetical protein
MSRAFFESMLAIERANGFRHRAAAGDEQDARHRHFFQPAA